MTSVKVLVCGGRKFKDYEFLCGELDRLHGEIWMSLVIEGGALGADRLARDWANARGIPVVTFDADWKKHGLTAGPVRNRKMLAEGKPGLVVAFPGGSGTADMIRVAKFAKVPVLNLAQALHDPIF